MNIFELIDKVWHNFLNIFPPEYQGIITSIILISLIVSFIALFMFNPIAFIIVLIITLPILYPIVVTFLEQIHSFVSQIAGKGPINILPPKP